MLNSGINSWLASGVVLAFAIGLGRLIRPQRSASDIYQGLLFLAFALAILNYQLLWNGFFVHWPHLLGVVAPVLALIGYWYFSYLSELEGRRLRWIGWHRLPVLFTFALYLPLYWQPAAVKQALQTSGKAAHVRWLNDYIAWAEVGLLSLLSGYILAVVYRLTLQWDKKSVAPLVRLVTLIFSLLMACLLIGLIVLRLMGKDQAFVALFLTSPGLVLLMYWISERFPNYRRQLSDGLKATRKSPSRLAGLDCDALLQSLDRHVREEQIYKQDEISLQQLAERLKINKHQLSELLNDKLKVNFNGYINRFRVTEAKRLLKDKPSMPVIDVAMASGFRSKSVFNRVFKQDTGLSPSEFRAQ